MMNLLLDKEIHLTVAGVSLALRGGGAFSTVLQVERYRPFLTADPRLVAAEVDVEAAEVNPVWDLPEPEVSIDGLSLTYRTYGGEGTLDAEAGRGQLQMTANVDAAQAVLDNYLRVAYALLLIRQSGFLFHSAGMIRDGRGYLFYGHSGSGKTTISRLSRRQATLLSDDLVAVRAHDSEWRVHGTPFWGELRGHPKTNASAPLRGVFGLAKSPEVRLEPMPQPLAVADVVSSVPVTCKEPPLSGRLIELCADLAAKSPCYRLHFAPDDSFWPAIDALET
jgi:hypothetical protein